MTFLHEYEKEDAARITDHLIYPKPPINSSRPNRELRKSGLLYARVYVVITLICVERELVIHKIKKYNVNVGFINLILSIQTSFLSWFVCNDGEA